MAQGGGFSVQPFPRGMWADKTQFGSPRVAALSLGAPSPAPQTPPICRISFPWDAKSIQPERSGRSDGCLCSTSVGCRLRQREEPAAPRSPCSPEAGAARGVAGSRASRFGTALALHRRCGSRGEGPPAPKASGTGAAPGTGVSLQPEPEDGGHSAEDAPRCLLMLKLSLLSWKDFSPLS